MELTGFDAGTFLREAWQKRPMLIRNPWSAWVNPLEPDELAGLACEPGIESRLMVRAPDRWQLEHGPLPEDRFSTLARDPWTLLVQAVDHHVPAVAHLLDAFRFIPNWRVDDVMVSYAVDGGGVGAHFDQYDVFLVQGLGQRRWEVGGRCDQSTALQPRDDVRLLADFEAEQEWILDPGDILYVPPGFAHNGVAVGDDCMTYSIGFRAPSRAELIAAWADHVVQELSDDDRYGDPGLIVQDNPGEILPAAVDRIQAMVADKILDRDAFALWFGEFSSSPKIAEIDWRPDETVSTSVVRAHIARGDTLRRNPASRFSFIRHQPARVTLFVDGTAHDCVGPAAAFSEALCAGSDVRVSADLVDFAPAVDLVRDLLNSGSVVFDTEA